MMKNSKLAQTIVVILMAFLAVGCSTTQSAIPADTSSNTDISESSNTADSSDSSDSSDTADAADTADTLTTSDTPSDAQALASFTPTRIGNPDVFDDVNITQLRQLNLVATNLVSVLLQIPELRPMSVTLQVKRPISAFGNVLVRVLEDAGFALQLVSADQGKHYVSYGRRFAETDRGPVTDFNLSINDISLSREYVVNANGIFPASLMSVYGTEHIERIEMIDSIFKEQGVQANAGLFVSGLRSEDSTSVGVDEIKVKPDDRLPFAEQTNRLTVLAQAKVSFYGADPLNPQLSEFDRYRRTVLVFDNKDKMYLGQSNKRAARLMVREFNKDDLYVVRACNDMDGVNKNATLRAIRVEEELIGNGVPQASIYLAPCTPTNYRHSADNSPVPVEVLHYRPKES